MPLTGVKELKQDFKAIARATNNGLRTAAFAGARVARDVMRAAVGPKDAKKIIAERKRGAPGIGLALAGPTKKAFYLRFREEGTQPHAIIARTTSKRTKKPKRPVLVMKGGVFIARKLSGEQTLNRVRTSKGAGRRIIQVTSTLTGKYGVRHPGQPARPVLMPAFHANEQVIVQAVGDRFNQIVIKQKQASGGE